MVLRHNLDSYKSNCALAWNSIPSDYLRYLVYIYIIRVGFFENGTSMSFMIQDISPFLKVIKENSEYDFTNYSVNSLNRRIVKIITDYKINFSDLIEKLESDNDFLESVVKKVTVNTTDFFRDIDLWLHLKDEVIPHYSDSSNISVLHAGCSTGQEVYSMMILLNEMNLLDKTRIFAGDINTDVLETSSKGVYKYFFNKDYIRNFDRVINFNKSRRKVNFEKYFKVNVGADTINMHHFLKEKPIYRKMDLTRDENPFKQKFDMIVCRNVIIYFNSELQNKVLNFFYKNLNPGGCLILGLHESIIGTYAALFHKDGNVYYKQPGARE